jgi:hypothetical protein
VTAAETLKIWTIRDNASAELTSSLQSVIFSVEKVLLDFPKGILRAADLI